MRSLESNNFNATTNDLNPKKNLSMNVMNQYGDKRDGFAEVAAFYHVTCRYSDRLPLQVDRNRRQACLFYLTPGLICEGYIGKLFLEVSYSHCRPYLIYNAHNKYYK